MALISEFRHTERVVPVVQKIVHEGMSADKATSVLQDFEEKAADNISDKFIFPKNDMGVSGAVYLSNNLLNMSIHAHIVFTINGKKYHFEEDIEEYWSREKAYRELVQKVSQSITGLLLNKSLESLRDTIGRLPR